MVPSSKRNSPERVVGTGEEGQAVVSLVLIMGLFLLAIIGFGVDLTNVWFHREAARAAADAACQAGALDVLEGSTVTSLKGSGFTKGTAGDCVGSPNATMCVYAAANGYSGTGLTSGAGSNSVSWSFPSSVPGVIAAGTYPFLQVTISENVRTYFMSLASAVRYLTLHMTCTCGVVQVKGSAPMVVLHPTMSGSFNNSGVGIHIVGGPGRGIQVNSTSIAALSGSALIDTSNGGPQQTGSDVALTGGPTQSPGGTCSISSGFCGGSTGHWRTDVLPVPDPFGDVPAPTAPANAATATSVLYGVDGCPDHRGCSEYYPGMYSSGIKLSGSTTTAIFRPGVYYMNGSLTPTANATLRNAKPPGWQPTDGIMFYFLSGSLSFAGATGTPDTTNIDNVSSTDMTCDGSAPAAALSMPATLPGNVLLGQCTKGGTYWDSSGNTRDARGTPGVRGLLVFQDHNNTTQPTITGSGSLVFGGALYFHSTGYLDVLKFSGNGTSGTFVIGQMVADQITLSGNGSVSLALNPVSTTNTSKVAIIQ